LALGKDVEMTRNQQADLALGQTPVERGQAFGRRSVLLGHVLVGRGTDEPVGNRSLSYPDIRKEDRAFRRSIHQKVHWKDISDLNFSNILLYST